MGNIIAYFYVERKVEIRMADLNKEA